MARNKRLSQLSTQNQNHSRRSRRLGQREGIVHETSLQISKNKNRHRGRNPPRPKACCTNDRIKAKIKSEKKHRINTLLSKKLIKKNDKKEVSLDECSSFSLNYVKMLMAGFAEGRRRAEQLVNLALHYGLRSGVVEKVSNDVYRVQTNEADLSEKPEDDPTDNDDDGTNRSESSGVTYSAKSHPEGSDYSTDRSETSEDSHKSRKGAERRRGKRQRSRSVSFSRPRARRSSKDLCTFKRRRSDRRKSKKTTHKGKTDPETDQPKSQARIIKKEKENDSEEFTR
uniref:Uncharacterized protein n=1 Tax=Timema poppense TaxID=170557 RepID=A0A7R9DJD7_TIMPO|nr:unnamed protein product [Timema poppensis]